MRHAAVTRSETVHPAETAVGEAARIAQLMGLPKWRQMSDMALVKRIESGLPLEAAERVARRLNPGDAGPKPGLVSRATVARVRKKPQQLLTKEMSERLFAVTRVLNAALRLWGGDDNAAAAFLNRPHALLEGRTPIDVTMESNAGADLVTRIIGEARAGVAV
jgi:putative toxin-antitoxin system antitoxin component (TIGR02293 family)